MQNPQYQDDPHSIPDKEKLLYETFIDSFDEPKKPQPVEVSKIKLTSQSNNPNVIVNMSNTEDLFLEINRTALDLETADRILEELARRKTQAEKESLDMKRSQESFGIFMNKMGKLKEKQKMSRQSEAIIPKPSEGNDKQIDLESKETLNEGNSQKEPNKPRIVKEKHRLTKGSKAKSTQKLDLCDICGYTGVTYSELMQFTQENEDNSKGIPSKPIKTNFQSAISRDALILGYTLLQCSKCHISVHFQCLERLKNLPLKNTSANLLPQAVSAWKAEYTCDFCAYKHLEPNETPIRNPPEAETNPESIERIYQKYNICPICLKEESGAAHLMIQAQQVWCHAACFVWFHVGRKPSLE